MLYILQESPRQCEQCQSPGRTLTRIDLLLVICCCRMAAWRSLADTTAESRCPGSGTALRLGKLRHLCPSSSFFFFFFLHAWSIGYISHRCENISDKSNPKRRVYFVAKLKHTVYQGGEPWRQEREASSRPHCISQKQRGGDCWCLSLSSLRSVGPQPVGCHCPLLGLVFPPLSNLDNPS